MKKVVSTSNSKWNNFTPLDSKSTSDDMKVAIDSIVKNLDEFSIDIDKRISRNYSNICNIISTDISSLVDYYYKNKTFDPVISWECISKNNYNLWLDMFDKNGNVNHIILRKDIKKRRAKIVIFGLKFITIKVGKEEIVIDRETCAEISY